MRKREIRAEKRKIEVDALQQECAEKEKETEKEKEALRDMLTEATKKA